MAAPVLIDTDPGIDDALALLLAWGSPEISVEAITTVAGNVSVEQGMVNVFRLLALRKPTPHPVVALGAAEPLARPLVTAQRYHGEDGLGDLTDWPETEKPPLEHDAVSVIIDQARRSQRLLTLVALGPLTNLALTLKADAGAVSLIGRILRWAAPWTCPATSRRRRSSTCTWTPRPPIGCSPRGCPCTWCRSTRRGRPSCRGPA